MAARARGVRAAAGRRRRRRLGDRAQRHPHRARRRRLEGGRARAHQRATSPIAWRPAVAQRAATELFIDTPRGGVRARHPHAAVARTAAARARRRRACGSTTSALAALLAARSRSRRCRRGSLAPLEPSRRVEREVGEDRVGAGALHRRSAPRARRRARRASRPAPRPSASRTRRDTWYTAVGMPNASFTRRTMSRYGRPGLTITMSAPSWMSRYVSHSASSLLAGIHLVRVLVAAGRGWPPSRPHRGTARRTTTRISPNTRGCACG